MIKVTRKVLTFEAVRFTGGINSFKAIRELMGLEELLFPIGGTLTVKTPFGSVKIHAGDWIIKGVDGKCYPCEDGTFAKLYDLEEKL
jgi:hypothetical protein